MMYGLMFGVEGCKVSQTGAYQTWLINDSTPYAKTTENVKALYSPQTHRTIHQNAHPEEARTVLLHLRPSHCQLLFSSEKVWKTQTPSGVTKKQPKLDSTKRSCNTPAHTESVIQKPVKAWEDTLFLKLNCKPPAPKALNSKLPPKP